MRECNLVVATSVLEDGIELPRCNLIVRYDPVIDYKSFAHSKGRARQQISYYISLVESINLDDFIDVYGRYMSTEKVIHLLSLFYSLKKLKNVCLRLLLEYYYNLLPQNKNIVHLRGEKGNIPFI